MLLLAGCDDVAIVFLPSSSSSILYLNHVMNKTSLYDEAMTPLLSAGVSQTSLRALVCRPIIDQIDDVWSL